MFSYLVVFLGAGLGGALRHGVNATALKLMGPAFPYGTMTVNIVGSFLMGAAAGWFALKADPGQSARLFLTTGILGGFTTFSAFSLDAAILIQRGTAGAAALYVAGSVILSIAALSIGLFLARQIA